MPLPAPDGGSPLADAMSTAYVVSQCCQAPVRLAFPNFAADCVEVICVGCGATAGTPGAEDSPDVEEFLNQPVPLLTLSEYGDPEISHREGMYEPWHVVNDAVPSEDLL